MARLSELLGRLSDDPNERGRQFERICKWYLLHDPGYRAQLKRVWLWDDWPGRWGPDAGIDLVAETHDGKLWAIQAKAYDPKYRITKHDVDTFLSESARPQFDYRLLIATTNLIGKKALRTLQEQEKPAGYKLLSDLRKAPLAWPKRPSDLRAPKPKPKKPRPHQRKAINAVVKGLAEDDRGQLIMACGTGKTLVGLWLVERLESNRTLILLPSLSLLAQTLREWTANAKVPFAVLPVCSDETVRGGGDNWLSHTSDLGLPVTTDPAEIAAFLRRRGPRVVFGTYHSSPRIAEAFSIGRTPQFDLAIADEAHRVAGATSSDFATILDTDAIGARKRLFMTATPRFFTGRMKKAAGEADYEIASMDDESHFGPVLHRLTFGEAIERDLLSDYQVLIVGVDDPTYRDYAERGTFVTRDGEEVTDARTLASHIAVAKAARKHDLRRTITFHSRIASARRFSTTFPDIVEWLPRKERPSGDLVCDFVSGEMPSGQRDTRLDRLRYLDEGERGLLSNARCLSEGVDVPTLDGVAFIDPRRSQVDIVQAVGRAMRKAKDKKLGTIILPVFIESTDDPEAVLSTSAFKHVWDVLKALRAHDEELADQFDSLRREMGRLGTGPSSVPSKLVFDVPETVGLDFQRAFETWLVRSTTESWEFWFGLLQSFVEQTGDARVPDKYVTDAGLNLGRWMGKQRTAYRQGRLRANRTARLEALSGWLWDLRAALWEEGLEHLRRFVEREGHARVAAKHKEEGFLLGPWVNHQRTQYNHRRLPENRIKRLEAVPGWVWDHWEWEWREHFRRVKSLCLHQGQLQITGRYVDSDGYNLGDWIRTQRNRRRTLSEEKRKLLEGLPGWVWKRREASWEAAFSALERFVKREGHSRVPQPHVEDSFGLGAWVTRQRFLRKTGRLPAGREKRLTSLPGWTWDTHADAWDDHFNALMRFVEQEGHARVPAAGDRRLERWLIKQRVSYHKGRLAPKRARRLEAVPGWEWDPRVAAWEDGLYHLNRYVEREGHARVPHSHLEGSYGLGGWVNNRRAEYRKGQLSEKHVTRLEAFPGWVWESRSAQWEEQFILLKRYVEREGNARVPTGHTEKGGRLGMWVVSQRQAYKQGRLASHLADRLESLTGWVWDANVAAWEDGFYHLTRYVEREGHARVPISHLEGDFKLGQWVGRQRGNHRKGTLSEVQVARLEGLSGWVWDAIVAAWEDGFCHLTRYAEREGHARVPGSHIEGSCKLGSWVMTRRAEYRNGQLDQSRADRLEALPGWVWDAREG